MPHVLYYQQAQLNTAVDDVADENRTNSIKSCPEITALGPALMVTAPTLSAQNTAESCQKTGYEGANSSFSPKRLRRAFFKQTLKDSYLRESHNPSTFPRSCDNDKNTSCQQTNIPASMDSKSVSQSSLYANHRDSTIQKLSPVQNQGSLPGAKKHCHRYQIFESKVKELKEYIEKHGHMNVTRKENQSLHHWIGHVRRSFQNIQKGQRPSKIALGKERMKMLEEINFDFNKQHRQSFGSNVEKLKEYIEKHGHMNVTGKENKSLHNWIRDTRSSFERIQQGQPPSIQLGQERMEMLEEINFDFSKQGDKLFESSVEKLKEYIEKYGHMNVTIEENKSLYTWIRDVRRSFKRTQERRSHTIKLGKERMKMLEGINFDFGPKRERREIETKDGTTIRAAKIQRRQKIPPIYRTTCPSTSQLLHEELPCKQSCPSFESSVEIGNMYLEEKDLAEQCEEHERIGFEGDLIPRWLLVGGGGNDEDQETSINEDHVLDDEFSAEKDFHFQD